MTASTVLSRRALNRATLSRQLLLERASMAPLQAIEHLLGLQAQTPHTWYVGLWTRLVDCRPEAVAELLTARRVVRLALMRSTIHLVSAADAVALRPLMQPVIERVTSGAFGRHFVGLDRAALVAAARAAFEAGPLTFSELGRVLAKEWPDRDPAALAQAIRAWVPLVQVPPRGVWGASGLARHAPLDTWLGAAATTDSPTENGRGADAVVLRYLSAFGPASVRDVQAWSGLTRLSEVLDRLRPRLATFRDEHGVELFDLPDAARPGPDVPAPARYLYDFDNLQFGHADRSRVVTQDYHDQNFDIHGPMPRIVLLDGFTAGTWTLDVHRGAAVLTVRPFRALSTADTESLAAEGEGLMDFAAARARDRDIRFVGPG